MMTNNRNMLLETISFIFLVLRDDVSQTRSLMEAGNKHFYGLWRMILQEFNMELLIWIVQKSIIKLQGIFESGLGTLRSNSAFKEYQLSLPYFVKSAQASNNPEETCGPVPVDLEEPDVYQVWDEVHGDMKATTELMFPFLGLFGIEEGNSISPSATEINTPAELSDHTKEFFKPPKKDHRGRGRCNDDADDAEGGVEIIGMGYNDEMEAPEIDIAISPNIVSVHIQDTVLEDVEAVTSGDIGDYHTDEKETSEAGRAEFASSSEKEFLYDSGNSSRSYKQFRSLVSV